jgi:NodT family efflux transporter outer membrane factor (OMF) lipoprotein
VDRDFVEEQWWQLFEDPKLNRYMLEAFSQNLTIDQAVARLAQMRSLHGVAQSTWYPAVSAQGARTESGELEETESAPGYTVGQSRYGISLTAAYEIDLWGKLSASRSAAFADLLASEDALRAVVISLAAQVTLAYYSVAELQQQVDLLDRAVASFEDSYELVLARYERGVAPSLDVYQAQTNLAGAKAQRALLEFQSAAAEHGFAILLGRSPQAGLVPKNTTIPDRLPEVPPGLPSRLLDRRPDIQTAYWQLVAADRRAAQAVAERFPSFSLTGSLNGGSNELSTVLDPANVIWTAMGNIVSPVFEGGRRKAQADRAEAVWEERLAAYKETVLGALKEVEDALVAGNRQREYALQLEEQVAAAEASVRLATERYLRGVSDYLPVVVAQTAYLNARRTHIAARRSLINTRVQLFTALGGAWTDTIIERHILGKYLNTEG